MCDCAPEFDWANPNWNPVDRSLGLECKVEYPEGILTEKWLYKLEIAVRSGTERDTHDELFAKSTIGALYVPPGNHILEARMLKARLLIKVPISYSKGILTINTSATVKDKSDRDVTSLCIFDSKRKLDLEKLDEWIKNPK